MDKFFNDLADVLGAPQECYKMVIEVEWSGGKLATLPKVEVEYFVSEISEKVTISQVDAEIQRPLTKQQKLEVLNLIEEVFNEVHYWEKLADSDSESALVWGLNKAREKYQKEE